MMGAQRRRKRKKTASYEGCCRETIVHDNMVHNKDATKIIIRIPKRKKLEAMFERVPKSGKNNDEQRMIRLPTGGQHPARSGCSSIKTRKHISSLLAVRPSRGQYCFISHIFLWTVMV